MEEIGQKVAVSISPVFGHCQLCLSNFLLPTDLTYIGDVHGTKALRARAQASYQAHSTVTTSQIALFRGLGIALQQKNPPVARSHGLRGGGV